MIKLFAIFTAIFSSFLSFASAFAQEIPEKVSGKGVLPSIETSHEYQMALEQALKNAVFNACVATKGQHWVAAKKVRLERSLLSRAWDFVAEYRIVGRGKDPNGSWIVVEAQIFWDKLKDALSLLELPELPAISITFDKSLKEESWSTDFLIGLKNGLSEKGFYISESSSTVPTANITLWVIGKNRVKVEVKTEADRGLFVKEFELPDDIESAPCDAGFALANLLIEKMVNEKVIVDIQEFSVALLGDKTYSDVVAFTKQLYIAGAVRVVMSEAESGKIIFKIVSLKPKEEILSKLVGLGFKVSAE